MRDPPSVDKAMANLVNISLAVALSVIQHMDSEVKKLDKEIAKIMKAIPQTLTSVKGIGLVYSACILAEIGSFDRFDDHNDIAKYTGLVWNQHQSGVSKLKILHACELVTSIFVII